MSRPRRQFLEGVAGAIALSIAGCQDASSDEETPTGQATTGSPTPDRLASPDVSDLDRECVESDFSGYTGTTPVPPPSRPPTPSGDSALDFAVAYERYYQRYLALYEIGSPTPEREDEPAHGFPTVRFEDEETEAIEETDSASVTMMRYDIHYETSREGAYREMGPRTVTYYVSDDHVIRAAVEESADPGPDPLEEGTIMRC